MDILLQITIILVCLFYGARKGGVALGLLGGFGLIIMAFAFGLPPGKPPVDVMLTIIAVVAASATLQASGGLEVLLLGAERLLRRNPKYVSILAPFVTCLLTMLCGTGHVVYTMLPIIYDISIKNNIRPEHPMAASSIASQMGILASPVSVAVVSLVAFLAKAPVDGHVIDFIGLLSVTIPATLAGVLAIGIAYGGMLGKVYAEILESGDPAPTQALLRNGSGRLQALLFGTLPQCGSELVSYTVYRWECALRASVVLGFVGAGGLGQLLDSAAKMFSGGEVSTILLVFIALVALSDRISALLRRALA